MMHVAFGSIATDAYAAGVAPGPKWPKSGLRGPSKNGRALAHHRAKPVRPNAVSRANADKPKELLVRSRVQATCSYPFRLYLIFAARFGKAAKLSTDACSRERRHGEPRLLFQGVPNLLFALLIALEQSLRAFTCLSIGA